MWNSIESWNFPKSISIEQERSILHFFGEASPAGLQPALPAAEPGWARPEKFPKCHTKRLPASVSLILEFYRVLKLKKTQSHTIEPVVYEDF